MALNQLLRVWCNEVTFYKLLPQYSSIHPFHQPHIFNGNTKNPPLWERFTDGTDVHAYAKYADTKY